MIDGIPQGEMTFSEFIGKFGEVVDRLAAFYDEYSNEALPPEDEVLLDQYRALRARVRVPGR